MGWKLLSSRVKKKYGGAFMICMCIVIIRTGKMYADQQKVRHLHGNGNAQIPSQASP